MICQDCSIKIGAEMPEIKGAIAIGSRGKNVPIPINRNL